jgi:medium-chain acyl-[acyl-carrier-protein] hydrolase
VQLPGRENRFSIPPFRRMDALVAAAADALAGSLDPPYAMFGCSLGALVAFELVSLLHQRSRPLPVHLFVASCAAPHTFHGFPAFSQLDDALLLAALEQRYGSLGLDALREPELRAFILPALRADLETIETYRYCPRPPLPCPITAFVGQDDHGLALVDTERWGDLTTDGFEVQTLPGGHFLPRECLSEVTDAIVEVLARS